MDRSILERLNRPRNTATRTATENATELRRSVLRNLANLLNTRTGSAPAQMDLGMPAPSEITHSTPNAVNLMLRNLRACIEKYEPRLRDVEITHVDSSEEVLSLRFQVTARIANRDGVTVSFDTVVNPGGHVKVQT
ncbi:MAG TPA: type VI secretion system baseplate subunit TssE [Planctomycetota bacterium]|jgi:type VI secretion system protein|nr:type VI secretion system baseplate subunit TssE [Planctomycetota bacterium]